MLHKLVIENLPPDSTSKQNAAIVTYPHSRTWPLILDSLGIAEKWLKGREKEARTIDYQVLHTGTASNVTTIKAVVYFLVRVNLFRSCS